MLFCCLWRNVYIETSCYKHFVVSRHQQTSPLATSHNLPWSGRAVLNLITPSRSLCVDSTRRRQTWLRIAISVYPACIRRPRYGSFCRNIAMTFGAEKLEWCGYPTVQKFWRCVYSFRQHLQTWRTDGRTPHDDIGRAKRACITSRGNYSGFSQRRWLDSNCDTTSRAIELSLEVRRFHMDLIWCHKTVFIARQHTDARYWYSNSVRPSVRPWRSGIRWKRHSILSYFFLHKVAQSF